MKQTPDTSLFLNSRPARKIQQQHAAGGQLFLGQKLLGELRILMRLSSGNNISDEAGSGGDSGPSSF